MRTRNRANIVSTETGNQIKSKSKVKKKSTSFKNQAFDQDEDKLNKSSRKTTKINDNQEKKTKTSSNLPSSQLGARKRGRPQSLKVSNQKVLSTLAKKQNTMETKLDQVESQSEIKLELKVKDKPSNANKTLIKFTNKTTGKSAKGKKVRTVKEDAKETHFEFPESSKLMRSTNEKKGKKATFAITTSVSKPASRSRATKQTQSSKNLDESAKFIDSGDHQLSLDEEASPSTASKKSSPKTKTSKKATSHKSTIKSKSFSESARSSRIKTLTQEKTMTSEDKVEEEKSIINVKLNRTSKKTTPALKAESNSELKKVTGRKTRASKRTAVETEPITNVHEPKPKIAKKQKTNLSLPKTKTVKTVKAKKEELNKTKTIKATKAKDEKGYKKVDKSKKEKEKAKVDSNEESKKQELGLAKLSTEESEDQIHKEISSDLYEAKSKDKNRVLKRLEQEQQEAVKTGQKSLKVSTKEILPTVVDVMESIKEKLETSLETELRHDNEERIKRENNFSDNDRTSMDANIDNDSFQKNFDEEKVQNGQVKKAVDMVVSKKQTKNASLEESKTYDLSLSNSSNFDNTIKYYDSKDFSGKRKASEIEEENQTKNKLSKQAKLEIVEPTFPIGGHLMTFGDDICGELGQKVIGLSKKRPVFVEGINDKVVYIAVGAMHNVCITSKNHVYTFGCNDEGALGRDTSSDSNLESKPLKVPINAKITKVTAGDSHTAALTSLGGVYLWGNFKDSNGSIGLTPDSSGSEIHPIHIPAFNLTFVDIASGGDHLLLLSDAGKVYSLGVAEQGQLGRFKPEKSKFSKDQKSLFLTPLLVEFSEEIECDRVWAGNYSSFARSKDNKIYAWGLNNYSQLGFKNSKNELIVPFPKHVPKFSELGCTIQDICAGQHHSLARDSNGKIYSFGRNEYGRLGHGQTGHDEDEPLLIELLKEETITAIATGSVCSFAVSEKGHLYSWGMGSSQLGIGDGDLYEPTRVISSVLGKNRVLKVSAGAQHTAIIVESEKSDRNGN